MNVPLHHMRNEYRKGQLSEDMLPDDPTELFSQWLHEAMADGVPEPTAMVLSTCTPGGTPSSRVVLLKDASPGGFVFFSNYDSRKGQELGQNPQASLLFFWPQVERQVRIEGVVSKIAAGESDAYFHSRPLQSQAAACASPQSKIIPDRDSLVKRFDAIMEKSKNKPPVRPSHWGGYCLWPVVLEFWQGRENRLHDRIRYQHKEDGWETCRLAP